MTTDQAQDNVAADVADGRLVAARAGSHRALGRLISAVEDGTPEARATARLIAASTARAHVIGLTGSPGVGKSTTISSLVAHFRSLGRRVAVLAVDPSSPFTGGALLGDRIRMRRHALDDGVYIRSMASRGHLGGLSTATPEVLSLLGAVGFDLVLLETVGVGQAEVEVASYADTIVVLVAAGMGDSIQAAKAGILEIGDVFVVNKADRPGAEDVARDLRQMLMLGEGPWRGFAPTVLLASAENADGIAELGAELDRHFAWLSSSGALDTRRTAQLRERIASLATDLVRARVVDNGVTLDALALQVREGRLDVVSAAEQLALLVAGPQREPAERG